MKNLTRSLFAVFSICLFSLPLSATHLLGGGWHYECLGGNDYRFTLTVFRDCGGTGAAFDSAPNAPFAGTVSIYLGDSQGEYQSLALPLPTIEPVATHLICTDLFVCVEKGTYVFDYALPETTESVHLSYQRCCLADDFANIVDAESTGFTYTIEVTPAARAACNNSPVCNGGLTCEMPNENFVFLAASDPDGDSLTYAFCAPLDGGGTDQFDFEAPDGVAPDPDLPPPYDEVIFLSPPYSAVQPFGETTAVFLNPSTGSIAGHIDLAGKYLYGICVSEYRDGVLLSETRCIAQHLSYLPSAVLGTEKTVPVAVSPNPVGEVLRIDLPTGGEKYGVEIIAPNGQVVQSFSDVPSGVFSTNVGDLPPGVYVLRALRGEEVLVGKWVKM